MVPPGLPNPRLLVNITGVLEAVGAAGLFVPASSRAAAWCLAALLVGMFPANVHAARSSDITATPFVPRTMQQLIYVAAAVTCATSSG